MGLHSIGTSHALHDFGEMVLFISRPPLFPPLDTFAPRRARTRFWEKRSSGPTSREPPPTALGERPVRERWATLGLGCGLFKKSALTVSSNNCSTKKEVKPGQVKGAWASLSMLSERGIAPFPDRRVASGQLSTPAARNYIVTENFGFKAPSL
jgi:hypothetical protein